MSVHLLGHLNKTLPFSFVDGPGNRFVVFLQGCNFDCDACHNPQTISEAPAHGTFVSVAELIEQIRPIAPFLSGLTVSGGEATQQPEFLEQLFVSIKSDSKLGHLTTFVDSNGSAPQEVWDRLRPVMDGAMIDLKAFDPAVHLELTGSPNAAVLESITHLAEIGLLYEVRLLIAHGFNDSPEAIAITADWLKSVAPDVRVKVIGFRRHGTRAAADRLQEPTPSQLGSIEDQLRDKGFNEVHVI